MVQQTIDSKFTEYGLGNNESNLCPRDKQFPVTVKKMALRDVQNENRIHNSVTNSPLLKERGQAMDAIKVSGTKRPSTEVPMSPPVLPYHSPSSNASNAHLVYVRRRSETEVGKSSACDVSGISTECENSGQLTRPKPQRKELPKASCIPTQPPMPVSPFSGEPGKPAVLSPLPQASIRFAQAEFNLSLSNLTAVKNMHWEDRYSHMQILLTKLDESDQEDYVQMLQSLSSVDLSRHAVELEKRSIQLSLEEAKEMQRVGVLNVLGKPMKNFASG